MDVPEIPKAIRADGLYRARPFPCAGASTISSGTVGYSAPAAAMSAGNSRKMASRVAAFSFASTKPKRMSAPGVTVAAVSVQWPTVRVPTICTGERIDGREVAHSAFNTFDWHANSAELLLREFGALSQPRSNVASQFNLAEQLDMQL
jgi:hypothetical protein